MSFFISPEELVACILSKWYTNEIKRITQQDEIDDPISVIQKYQVYIGTHTYLVTSLQEKIKQVLQDVKSNPFSRQNEYVYKCCESACSYYSMEIFQPSKEQILQNPIPYQCLFTRQYARLDLDQQSTCVQIRFKSSDSMKSMYFTVHVMICTFLQCCISLYSLDQYLEQQVSSRIQDNTTHIESWPELGYLNQCIRYIYLFLQKHLSPVS